MKSFLHSGSRQPSAWFKWATRTPRQRCRRIDFTPLKFSISYSKRNRVTPSHLLVKSHDNCRVQDNQAEFQSAKVDVWLDTPITMIAHCPGHPHELPGLHSVVAFSQIEQFSRSQEAFAKIAEDFKVKPMQGASDSMLPTCYFQNVWRIPAWHMLMK